MRTFFTSNLFFAEPEEVDGSAGGSTSIPSASAIFADYRKLFLRKRTQGILALLLGNQASGSKMAPKMCILLQFEN